jgi:hypothetical protein
MIGTLGVTLKWWYAFIPFFILKRILKVKVISKEGEVISHKINGVTV